MIFARLVALAPLLSLVLSSAASAQSCTVAPASGSYGTVDILAGAAVDTSTTFVVNCTGIVLLTVGICVQFDGGTPGTSTTRSLGSGGNTLQHDLYSNSGRTTVWGSWGYGASAYGTGGVAYNLGLSVLGSGSHTFTVYGRILASQQSRPPGSYTWTTPTPTIAYGYGATSCASQPAGGTASAGTSSWTATIAPNCLLSAGALNFGSAGLLASAIDASATLTVQCTATTPYSVSLDTGGNAIGAQRRMRFGVTASYVNYGLYTDAGRTNAWSVSTDPSSCTSGAATCALGTGTGAAQSIFVYGRVPAQASPAPGSYTDTVVVTVTY